MYYGRKSNNVKCPLWCCAKSYPYSFLGRKLGNGVTFPIAVYLRICAFISQILEEPSMQHATYRRTAPRLATALVFHFPAMRAKAAGRPAAEIRQWGRDRLLDRGRPLPLVLSLKGLLFLTLDAC